MAIEPTYQGYSIGKWIDQGGDGLFDVRSTGLPLMPQGPIATGLELFKQMPE
jgi:hypothetical protein